jgi:hypothetical protein
MVMMPTGEPYRWGPREHARPLEVEESPVRWLGLGVGQGPLQEIVPHRSVA